ncbi:prephenate dehydrogenase [Fimbriimonas ginsengisoli]|uniref:Prephenate dehydrogenase n=1 Tax=Fimbriimonas ginsengisoli Gsoil 348 TaxID=661478 RepID=A0A068NYF7_FIMGI|nr:prephenate dehydrogenase/arogenate dehydrogenase family protein [Fimbriimonas ginsengisoli]AIE88085.1 Prephenate dehydrogenase [Fimbriimonas ginsengisoli Gsoil 348]
MKVGVVGLGLIGGSIGLALRDPSREILGFDPSEANAKLALDRFCVDRLAPLEEVAKAEIVFVAAPPLHVIAVLDQIAKLRGEQTVVTDCTSVKAEVAAWAVRTGAPWFVGGHPMAGHEKSGPGFASSWMFRNARWILTPVKATDKAAVKQVEELVRAMGAVPVRAKPDAHDRQVAILSHLPHAFASVLVTLGEELERTDVAAGSWRDLTRVGGVDPDLWSQILLGNRTELTKVLEDAERELAALREALQTDDRKAVRAILERSRIAKKKQEA